MLPDLQSLVTRYSTKVRFWHVTKLKLPILAGNFQKMLQSTRKKCNKGWLYPVVTLTLVTQGVGGPPCYHYKALQSGGGAKKLVLQSVTLGVETPLFVVGELNELLTKP